jgi:hypothetical protein
MKTPTLAFATLLLLSGCSGLHVEKPSGSGAALADVVSGLEREAYTRTERCLSTFDYDSVEVAGEEYLLFYGRGDDVWVNELSSRCPGIEIYDALAFELHTDRICALDSVSGINRGFLSWDKGPTCALGEFSQVSPAQAAQLRRYQ